MDKYMGLFKDRDDVAAEFQEGTGDRWWRQNFVPAADFPTDEEIVVAIYEYEGYNGDAFVLFERGGVPYEVHGGHCSCYGLEDQWEPEETTREALQHRLEKGAYGVVNSREVREAIRAYLDRTA